MANTYVGRCFCGRVRFEVRGEPLTFYVCHCTNCQFRAGGPALPVMWIRRQDLHIIEGEPTLRILDLGDGKQRRRQVCPRCDTQLWGEPANKPTMAALRPNTLEDQDQFDPIAHVFTSSKRPWFLIPDGVPTFEKGVGERELLRLWQERKLGGKV